ncbi:MAG: hypothetical protein H0X62_16985 [Bacteroidetes bacterium]|nr:hypothetical protein [Bacteroidota bacterium]
MKKILLILFYFALIASCESNKNELAGVTKIWDVFFDEQTSCLKLKKVNDNDFSNLKPENLTNHLNQNWDNVKLEFVKTSNDTIYVKINNSTFLTEVKPLFSGLSMVSADISSKCSKYKLLITI